MKRRYADNLEAEIGISEDTLRRNLHMMPRAEVKPSAGYKVLHGINAFLRLIIVLLLLLLIFRIQKIDVKGSENISDEQVMNWLSEDKKACNSLYAMYKYNIRKEELSPAIETAHIAFRLPWYVRIDVKEYPPAGMVEYEGVQYVFNEQGLIIADGQVDHYGTRITGVTLASTALFKPIAFNEGELTEQILSMIKMLDNNMLEPDEIRWLGDEEGWQLRFDTTWANVGTVVTDEKIQELAALYTEVKHRDGIIHLEYYESGDEIVRFEQGLPAEAYEEEEEEEY